MIVRVKLFAFAKQAAGAESIELTVPDAATVADVRQALLAAVPDLVPAAKHLLFAVNTEYASDAKAISTNDEVACIPPVSGG
jgi:molybdopterin converting factor subunit 1